MDNRMNDRRENWKMEAKTMFIRWIMLIALTGLAAVFPACSANQTFHQESMLDQNWGRSFESQKYNQILHPEAGKNLAPVGGIDGQAALKAVEKYRKGGGEKTAGSPDFGILTIKK
jgi:hypothetical protein